MAKKPSSHLKMIDLLSGQHTLTAAARVVRTISAQGIVTAEEISRQTGLARSTVSTALSELRDIGLVVERDAERPRIGIAGRPVKRMTLNPDAGTALGIHLGLAEIDLAVLDLAHNLIGRHRVPMGYDYAPKDAADRALGALAPLYGAHGLSSDGLIGVGISVSGPVSPEGQVLRSSILPKWAGQNVAELFGPIFQRPVIVENEANCAAISEMTWGSARGVPDFLLCKFDLGVGGAIVLDKRIVTGVAGGGGEFGHIRLVPNGELCRCGNRGCLETIASFNLPLERLGRRLGRTIDMEEGIALARDGDNFARVLIREAGKNAGWGLAVLCSALNPPLVLVSGRMALAGDQFMEPLMTAFERNVMLKPQELPPHQRTRVEAGTFIEDDSLRGAAGLVLHSIDELIQCRAS